MAFEVEETFLEPSLELVAVVAKVDRKPYTQKQLELVLTLRDEVAEVDRKDQEKVEMKDGKTLE